MIIIKMDRAIKVLQLFRLFSGFFLSKVFLDFVGEKLQS